MPTPRMNTPDVLCPTVIGIREGDIVIEGSVTITIHGQVFHTVVEYRRVHGRAPGPDFRRLPAPPVRQIQSGGDRHMRRIVNRYDLHNLMLHAIERAVRRVVASRTAGVLLCEGRRSEEHTSELQSPTNL